MASGIVTSQPCPRPETSSRMLHAQDSHAIESLCCHRFPAAHGETDRRKLKLVPFVGVTAARNDTSPRDHGCRCCSQSASAPVRSVATSRVRFKVAEVCAAAVGFAQPRSCRGVSYLRAHAEERLSSRHGRVGRPVEVAGGAFVAVVMSIEYADVLVFKRG